MDVGNWHWRDAVYPFLIIFNTRSNHPIKKKLLFFYENTWHQSPAFCAICLSIHPYLQSDARLSLNGLLQMLSSCLVFKILFLYEMYDMYLIFCVRLPVWLFVDLYLCSLSRLLAILTFLFLNIYIYFV